MSLYDLQYVIITNTAHSGTNDHIVTFSFLPRDAL